jgi:hydrogenase nickel incorporation protein HypB
MGEKEYRESFAFAVPIWARAHLMTVRIPVVEKILGANDRLADENRARLDAAGVFALNLMASPGAGKTSLIEHTIRALAGQLRLAVIDGDIATSIDADRAAAAGATAVQINTGGECHLDAVMLQKALGQIELARIDLLIVENVGNLVCPANFRLGTHSSVLIASVPEGHDKPYKYPGMYRGVAALVINKIDLLPYVAFDMDYFRRGVEILNPGVVTFPISCRTGEGLANWLQWVGDAVKEHRLERV